MSKKWLENVPAYFERYVAMVQEDDIVEALSASSKELENWIASIKEEKGSYAYEEGKWTVNEVIVHIIDTERIFQYRSLCIARGEMNGMPGFDHDSYVKNAEANTRSLPSLLEEFKTVRASSISLFANFDDARVKFKGMANGLVVQPVLYGFLMSGHLRHHLNVLQTRY